MSLGKTLIYIFPIVNFIILIYIPKSLIYKHAIIKIKEWTWGCEVSEFMVQQSIYVLGQDINLYISYRQFHNFNLYP